MTPTFDLADESALAALLELMPEFYALEHLRFDVSSATGALNQLFANDSLGLVFLIRVGGELAGYTVIGFNFSLEFRGRYAWIDELYVREAFRGKGVGAAALEFVEAVARDRGFSAIRLEVARRNTRARRLYQRDGFEDYNRDLLTRWIR